MQPRDFCYWLQGFFEVTDATDVTPKQAEIIKNHLNLVFTHVLDKEYPEKDKDKLQKIHDGNKRFKGQIDDDHPGFDIMC